MKDPRHTVYSITSLSTGKVYVGATQEYRVRMLAHLGYPRRREKLHNPLYAAMLAEGPENFKFSVLGHSMTKTEAEEAEAFWVKELRANDANFGYNTTSGGADMHERAAIALAKRKELQALDPEAYAKAHGDRVRKSWAAMSPERKAEIHAKRESKLTKEQLHARAMAGVRGLTPEVIARRAESLRAYFRRQRQLRELNSDG